MALTDSRRSPAAPHPVARDTRDVIAGAQQRQTTDRTPAPPPAVAEIAANMPALHALIAWKRPSRILCIGRVAERAAQGLGVSATYVRHPAQGGLAAFREGAASFIEQGD